MSETTSTAATTGSPRLRGDKRAAIIGGALKVFARDGFTRASIDAIAGESGVSTRTIYKHFSDKTAIFTAVIADSAAAVAARESALIEHHLDGVTDSEHVEPALLAFARAWLSGTTQPDAHRALVRQVNAEAEHLGAEVVSVWWQAGPARVRSELAARLRHWAEVRLLRIDDAERAAVHFSRLVSAMPGPPGASYAAAEQEDWIAAGVRAFLNGYHA
ncbi:TetR/AcrR family transcriptional regulator [Micromonospora zhanjiangensis]|uniref:TetR/AcrR family transcriptional regulator n=1 Tax=Micromonospora zhanjiangensis TaxID=1522057 RepID=A0ABV8KMN4_9ACTN